MIDTRKLEKELHLTAPWKIDADSPKPYMDTKLKDLNIFLSYARGAQFADETGTPCPAHDTYNKTWRHIDQGKRRCYIHCKTPRIQTTEGNVRLINVPWARQGSSFTLGFEMHILSLLAKGAMINHVCVQLHETSNRIALVSNYWVNKAYLSQQVDPTLDTIGIDEQSHRKDKQHITTLIDLKNQRVLLVTEGKTEEALPKIKTYLQNKGISLLQIKHVLGDFYSQTSLDQIQASFPNATLIWDRFYILKHLNETISKIVDAERKNIWGLTKHRPLLQTDPTQLTTEQKSLLLQITTDSPKIGQAYRLNISLGDLWEQQSVQKAKIFLESWCHAVEKSGLVTLKEFVKILQKRKNFVVSFTAVSTYTTSLENIHDKIHQIRSRKSGLKNFENFSNMVYLFCGKLYFPDFSEHTDPIS